MLENTQTSRDHDVFMFIQSAAAHIHRRKHRIVELEVNREAQHFDLQLSNRCSAAACRASRHVKRVKFGCLLFQFLDPVPPRRR